jgi:hypothetical protein
VKEVAMVYLKILSQNSPREIVFRNPVGIRNRYILNASLEH